MSSKELERFAFTPGPWQACHGGTCKCRQVWSIPGDVPVFTADASKGEMVQVGLAHHKWGDSADMIYGEIPESMTLANARLVAAAPDLYAACILARHELDMLTPVGKEPEPRIKDVITRLAAAVRLADTPASAQQSRKRTRSRASRKT